MTVFHEEQLELWSLRARAFLLSLLPESFGRGACCLEKRCPFHDQVIELLDDFKQRGLGA